MYQFVLTQINELILSLLRTFFIIEDLEQFSNNQGRQHDACKGQSQNVRLCSRLVSWSAVSLVQEHNCVISLALKRRSSFATGNTITNAGRPLSLAIMGAIGLAGATTVAFHPSLDLFFFFGFSSVVVLGVLVRATLSAQWAGLCDGNQKEGENGDRDLHVVLFWVCWLKTN